MRDLRLLVHVSQTRVCCFKTSSKTFIKTIEVGMGAPKSKETRILCKSPMSDPCLLQAFNFIITLLMTRPFLKPHAPPGQSFTDVDAGDPW